ncbi:MAG: hypothetical protein WC058_00815 [Phycisphaeraceae bacterium]
MNSSEPPKPKSFRLSRGRSDLGLLLFAIGLFVLGFYYESMALWVMRGIGFTTIVLLVWFLVLILSDKSRKYVVPDAGLASILARIAVLGFWAFYLWRGFQAGSYIDTLLCAMFVIVFAILEMVGIRNRRRMLRA